MFWRDNQEVITRINPDDLNDWSCSCTSFALFQRKVKCICYWFAVRKLATDKINEIMGKKKNGFAKD